MRIQQQNHVYRLLGICSFILLNIVSTFGQCADGGEITSNSKCSILTWNVAPSSIPPTITINGEVYSLSSSTATSATYERVIGNGCNNYGTFSGDITIGTDVCTYLNGVLTGSSSLPVELVRFEATTTNLKTILQWATSSEINNEGFEIQKSRNGSDWKAIGWTEGLANNEGLANYQFMDQEIIPGLNYYRLKQIDFDGNHSFSNIEKVNVQYGDQDGFQVFPNPANGAVSFSGVANEDLEKITIYNQVGKKVMEFDGESRSIDLNGFEKGIYYVEATFYLHRTTRRLVIQ